MDQLAFQFATRGYCIKDNTYKYKNYLCSKQSSLLSFYAVPFNGKLKGALANYTSISITTKSEAATQVAERLLPTPEVRGSNYSSSAIFGSLDCAKFTMKIQSILVLQHKLLRYHTIGAVALWIHVCLPSCDSGLESNAQNHCFFSNN